MSDSEHQSNFDKPRRSSILKPAKRAMEQRAPLQELGASSDDTTTTTSLYKKRVSFHVKYMKEFSTNAQTQDVQQNPDYRELISSMSDSSRNNTNNELSCNFSPMVPTLRYVIPQDDDKENEINIDRDSNSSMEDNFSSDSYHEPFDLSAKFKQQEPKNFLESTKLSHCNSIMTTFNISGIQNLDETNMKELDDSDADLSFERMLEEAAGTGTCGAFQFSLDDKENLNVSRQSFPRKFLPISEAISQGADGLDESKMEFTAALPRRKSFANCEPAQDDSLNESVEMEFTSALSRAPPTGSNLDESEMEVTDVLPRKSFAPGQQVATTGRKSMANRTALSQSMDFSNTSIPGSTITSDLDYVSVQKITRKSMGNVFRNQKYENSDDSGMEITKTLHAVPPAYESNYDASQDSSSISDMDISSQSPPNVTSSNQSTMMQDKTNISNTSSLDFTIRTRFPENVLQTHDTPLYTDQQQHHQSFSGFETSALNLTTALHRKSAPQCMMTITSGNSSDMATRQVSDFNHVPFNIQPHTNVISNVPDEMPPSDGNLSLYDSSKLSHPADLTSFTQPIPMAHSTNLNISLEPKQPSLLNTSKEISTSSNYASSGNHENLKLPVNTLRHEDSMDLSCAVPIHTKATSQDGQNSCMEMSSVAPQCNDFSVDDITQPPAVSETHTTNISILQTEAHTTNTSEAQITNISEAQITNISILQTEAHTTNTSEAETTNISEALTTNTSEAETTNISEALTTNTSEAQITNISILQTEAQTTNTSEAETTNTSEALTTNTSEAQITNISILQTGTQHEAKKSINEQTDVLSISTNEITLAENINSLPVAEANNSLPVAETINQLPLVETINSLPVAEANNSLPAAETINQLPLVVETINSLPVAEANNSLPVAEANNSLPVAEANNSLPVAETINSLPVAEANNSLPVAESINQLPLVETINQLPFNPFGRTCELDRTLPDVQNMSVDASNFINETGPGYDNPALPCDIASKDTKEPPQKMSTLDKSELQKSLQVSTDDGFSSTRDSYQSLESGQFIADLDTNPENSRKRPSDGFEAHEENLVQSQTTNKLIVANPKKKLKTFELNALITESREAEVNASASAKNASAVGTNLEKNSDAPTPIKTLNNATPNSASVDATCPTKTSVLVTASDKSSVFDKSPRESPVDPATLNISAKEASTHNSLSLPALTPNKSAMEAMTTPNKTPCKTPVFATPGKPLSSAKKGIHVTPTQTTERGDNTFDSVDSLNLSTYPNPSSTLTDSIINNMTDLPHVGSTIKKTRREMEAEQMSLCSTPLLPTSCSKSVTMDRFFQSVDKRSTHTKNIIKKLDMTREINSGDASPTDSNSPSSSPGFHDNTQNTTVDSNATLKRTKDLLNISNHNDLNSSNYIPEKQAKNIPDKLMDMSQRSTLDSVVNDISLLDISGEFEKIDHVQSAFATTLNISDKPDVSRSISVLNDTEAVVSSTLHEVSSTTEPVITETQVSSKEPRSDIKQSQTVTNVNAQISNKAESTKNTIEEKTQTSCEKENIETPVEARILMKKRKSRLSVMPKQSPVKTQIMKPDVKRKTLKVKPKVQCTSKAMLENGDDSVEEVTDYAEQDILAEQSRGPQEWKLKTLEPEVWEFEFFYDLIVLKIEFGSKERKSRREKSVKNICFEMLNENTCLRSLCLKLLQNKYPHLSGMCSVSSDVIPLLKHISPYMSYLKSFAQCMRQCELEYGLKLESTKVTIDITHDFKLEWSVVSLDLKDIDFITPNDIHVKKNFGELTESQVRKQFPVLTTRDNPGFIKTFIENIYRLFETS